MPDSCRSVASALLATAAFCLASAVVAAPPDPAELEPGVTLRAWQSAGPLECVHEPAAGRSPDVDERRDAIDRATGDFGGLERYFVVEATAWLRTTARGEHLVRLTSDDGSMPSIDGERVVRHRGLHAATPRDGALRLEPGLHRLRILMFENDGEEALRPAWRPPGAREVALVPPDVLFTERGVTRVVAGGEKKLAPDVAGLRAGDGIPLASMHPMWRLETARPPGFEPMVGCLAVLPDGRLLVGTLEPKNDGVRLAEPNGTLWVLSNLDAADPADITVEVFAEGLHHPLGALVADGDLYVCERDQVTRFRDPDGDGVYQEREPFALGWKSDNDHHVTFGLARWGDFLFATLSTSIGVGDDEVRSGEVRGMNGPNPEHRGTLLRISLEDGSWETIGGGFRTPNGVEVLSNGTVLVGDNRGAWMPANRVNAIPADLPAAAGAFHGHYNETRVRTARYPEGGVPSSFAERAPVPPALWLPHDEIADTPTDFVELRSGPFAGQVLASDVQAGGLRRLFLERVGGVVQGAAFRHARGFEGGTNRLAFAPDGTLYVGCIGERVTRSWRGTRWGLQRLVPTGETAFEFERVEAVPGGFRVTFTRPVGPEDLEDLAAWRLRDWTYRPTPDDGGPKIDERTLRVTSATPAMDGRSVRLEVAGLRTGRVVHLHFDRSSAAGEPMWSPEAWYTLNVLPRAGMAARPGRDPGPPPEDPEARRILVFTRTLGFRHASIPDGIEAFGRIGRALDAQVEATEDPNVFTDANLARYDVVVFCNTTGDVLDLAQEAAFERFIRAGGGFVGVHSASDTEYDWPWYAGLVGAYFKSHPPVQEARIEVLDDAHPSTRHLRDRGGSWTRTDEWYCFRSVPAPSVHRLLRLDETTYAGGTMGTAHPIAWCHAYDGGRAFYTAGGHTKEAYRERDFVRHLLGGTAWAAGWSLPEDLDESGLVGGAALPADRAAPGFARRGSERLRFAPARGDVVIESMSVPPGR